VSVPIQRLISKHKLDPDSLKAAFDHKSLEKRPQVKKLVEAIRDVIRDGINRNRTDYRLYKAMDWSYDQPFYQVSYTQLRGLMSSQPDDNKVLETVNSWGLSHLLPDILDADGKVCCGANGRPLKAVNLPVFFQVFVPVCMAYITIRWAKLFNDRNLNPLYKYEPVQYTKENRFRCEVLTQIVQRMATQFDYKSDLRQTILQTLLYGFCINFPREAWFVEKQLDESGDEQIVREGLRFNMPHPSRIYYDLYHRLSSLNSNSGCEYAGYWELCRYKDIHDNELYWNKDAIGFGALSWFDIGVSDFLDHVFPCTLKFPNVNSAGGGVGPLDRQHEAASTYGQGDFNAATLLTQHFQRIIPADYGLGDYKYPVWFRFVYASDTAVIWAEPLAFDRLPTYAYDADFNRSRFRSLALEIMPFQDHVGNLLSQWILAVKENLINPVFYDKDKIPAEYLKRLQNLGQKMYNGRLFIPYSGTETLRMKVDQREAFYVPPFSHHQTGEVATLISGVLSMLDRVMQLSPQEIGQAAQHEQTAEETRVISQNTSTRVTFTGSFIDDGDYAKKVAIYDATMAHADDEVTVGISSSLAATDAEFKKLLDSVGFTIQDDTTYDPENPDAMRSVKGKKSALKLESFASTRDASDRIDNPAIADAMSKIFLAVANNPVLIQAIGPMQLVELLNQIITTTGLPKEFKLKGKQVDLNAGQEEQASQVQGMLKEFAGQIQQLVASKQQETLQIAGQQAEQAAQQAAGQVAQVIGQQVQQVAQQAEAAGQQTAQALQAQQAKIEELGQAIDQLTQVIDAAQAGMGMLAQPAPPPMVPPVPAGPLMV
jgi:hypothetical protein